LAIIEITPDSPSLTTIDRLLESIRNSPEGLTVKQLADLLNRPVSMIQICLKISIASRKVAIKQQTNRHQLAKVYILKPERVKSSRQFQVVTNNSYRQLTPMGLRELTGLTKAQLAAELGLSVSTINAWEQNRSQPKLIPSQLKQMMSVYQCTLDELIAAFE
jgi:DNA-binding transcriptional regulator YiaG